MSGCDTARRCGLSGLWLRNRGDLPLRIHALGDNSGIVSRQRAPEGMANSLKPTRLAGLLYLIVVVAGLFTLKIVPDQIIVPGDAAATADHLRASETLFRFAMLIDLLAEVLFLIVVIALYRLLKDVHEGLSSLMVVFAAISVPIALVAVSLEIAAVSLVGNTDLVSTFGRSQLDALATLLLRVHGGALLVDEMLWGLWLFPLGILQLRSGFVPRLVGVLAIVGGAGFLVDFGTSLVAPDVANAVATFTSLAQAGEMATIVWLLVARSRPTRAVTPKVIALAT